MLYRIRSKEHCISSLKRPLIYIYFFWLCFHRYFMIRNSFFFSLFILFIFCNIRWIMAICTSLNSFNTIISGHTQDPYGCTESVHSTDHFSPSTPVGLCTIPHERLRHQSRSKRPLERAGRGCSSQLALPYTCGAKLWMLPSGIRRAQNRNL